MTEPSIGTQARFTICRICGHKMSIHVPPSGCPPFGMPTRTAQRISSAALCASACSSCSRRHRAGTAQRSCPGHPRATARPRSGLPGARRSRAACRASTWRFSCEATAAESPARPGNPRDRPRSRQWSVARVFLSAQHPSPRCPVGVRPVPAPVPPRIREAQRSGAYLTRAKPSAPPEE